MNGSLFRKKNLERISSPEQLNDYIKVSNPSVWLIISALIIIIIAFSIWAFSGNITSEVSATGVFYGDSQEKLDSVVCYVDANRAQKISAGMDVRIYDRSKPMETYVNGTVVQISPTPVKKDDLKAQVGNEYVADNLLNSDYGVGVLIKINKTPDGGFDWGNKEAGNEDFLKLENLCNVDIVIESVAPIEFLFNSSN